jgi:mono/diheme cytochrome c family protein
MINAFYDLLDRIGYLHPIHPALVHLPIGLVVGAFFLGWIALLFKRPHLLPSAYQVLVIAFVSWFPTVLFGYLDWQRYYAGAMLHPIVMKLILAGLLFVLLSAGVILGARKNPGARVMVFIYTLSFATVATLGYYGGQLVYTGATPAGPASYRAGEQLFDANCSGCHAHGGNLIAPNLPLRGAPQLANPEQFIAFLRAPKLPNGEKGAMPAFPPARLGDQDARALYDYIEKAIAAPDRGQPPLRK